MLNSKDVLRIMESNLSLKKGSLDEDGSFKVKVNSPSVMALRNGRWEARWDEGEKKIRLSSFLNEKSNRYDLTLEISEDGRSKFFTYCRDFLSSEDAGQEIRGLCETAVNGHGIRSIGYMGPKWK
jgi:hypothetical protein